MQAAHIVDQLISRTNVEMVGIGKLHLTIEIHKFRRGNAALDSGAGAYVHKDRGLNIPVNCMENAATCATVFF